jgi:hypothetical protein
MRDRSKESLAGFERAKRYVLSGVKGRMNRGAFGEVRTYCTFIGYPRSGHSIFGSMLDAHPEIIIAHELDALMFLEAGFGREQLYSLLLDKSRLFRRRGAVSSGYTYRVPNQHQGEFTRLRVIGDKKGAGTVKRLADRPELLERLRETIDVPVKFVHVLRNPYDNIATIFQRKLQKLEAPPSLAESTDYYFSLCETVAELKARVPVAEMIDVRLEEFISDPKGTLRRACEFLGVDAGEEYLSDCAAIVYESPNKSRHKAEWTPALIDDVARRMARFEFLSGYTFEN